VALLVTAVAPALVMLSEAHLQHAASAFQAGDCTVADTQALASINDLSVRSQPYQMLGYCQLRDGRVDDAIVDMQDAVHYDPRNWEYHYSLAIAKAYAGANPRSALRTAMRLDPADPIFDPLLGTLKSKSPEVWLVDARNAAGTIIASGRLSLS
jgi:Flp pilus assembly protein TadD